MNAPDRSVHDFAALLARTREPFPASTKVYLESARADLAEPLRVPLREVLLTNGERVHL